MIRFLYNSRVICYRNTPYLSQILRDPGTIHSHIHIHVIWDIDLKINHILMRQCHKDSKYVVKIQKYNKIMTNLVYIS